MAEIEEAKTDAWFAEKDSLERANRATLARQFESPPSPFYFNTPAYFPLNGFGPRGAVVDRPGALIYEGMEFSFDRSGNYTVRFSILPPPMPTTIDLQIHLQTNDGCCHTISLAPMSFRPEKDTKTLAQMEPIRDYTVTGHAEILRTNYWDFCAEGTISRAGSARFGYGMETLRQTAAR
jgi:hypothetical protein